MVKRGGGVKDLKFKILDHKNPNIKPTGTEQSSMIVIDLFINV